MAQKQFFPISEVKWDIGRKEWQSSTLQQHAAAQVRCEVQNKEFGKLPIRRRRRRRKKLEDGTFLEQRPSDKSNSKKAKTADGGLDHLRILADSAELLLESGNHGAMRVNQYQGQRPMENPLNVMWKVDNLLAVTVFPMQGRIRLSQLRRLARLKKHQVIQDTQGHQIHVHVDHKTCEDAQDVGKVASDQNKEVMGPQDVEALVAKCYSQMVEGIQEDIIHEDLHQQRTTDQPVEQLNRELVKLSEEAEKTTSCATGKTRLNQLKCEARLRNTDVLEGKHD